MNKANMQQNKNGYPWQSLRVPFSREEKELLRNFLKKTGRSAGPWVRIVILQAIKEEEKQHEN